MKTAEFSSDGSWVVTVSADYKARIWKLDPLALIAVDQRQDYVCRERLNGAQSFTYEEMQDPILRGRDDLHNSCDRAGPFSLAYYAREADALVATIRSAFSQH